MSSFAAQPQRWPGAERMAAGRGILRERPAPATLPQPVWELLWHVLSEQITLDALLLWRYQPASDTFVLSAAAPTALVAPEVLFCANESLRLLSAQRLHLLAHVHCTSHDEGMERVLAELGLRSAISCLGGVSEGSRFIVTAGFRRRWEFVSEHAPALSAFAEFLRACQEIALRPVCAEEGAPSDWWARRIAPPLLWQQSYRPSILRTVHDLMETLAGAARALRHALSPTLLPTPEQTLALAHRAATLLERWEEIYLGGQPSLRFEELLSQALLLVRNAFYFCRGTSPGCLAVVRQRPAALPGETSTLRHMLIDWVGEHIESEHDVE